MTEFEDLLRNTISVIKPTVVVASGDLTDARGSGLNSVQHLREWQIYKDILTRSGVLQLTKWLDIRGNHDTFNVDSFSGRADFYKNFSVQGTAHERSYSHQVEVNGNRYTFLGVDASLEPGPKRPFNFIGDLPQSEINHLRQLLIRSKEFNSDYLIWFGHYPTSCITSSRADTDIRSLIGGQANSLVYLCGHLHTFGGMVSQMYTLQKAGFLELELGDWKLNRMFRVAAVDHGLFSFVDLRYNQFPIVLITNPKSATIHIPGREDLHETSLRSSHIRILAYSTSPIRECRLRIDQADTFQLCSKSSTAENLFVAPWNPQDYRHGTHTLEVTVEDEQGRKETVVQVFSFDGSSGGNYRLLARFMLMTHFWIIFILLFAFAYSLCVVPLVVFRVWHHFAEKRPQIRWKWLRLLVRRFWLLCSVNRLFYPLLAFYLYILLGPWTVGEVVDGHLGWVFLWGIFVKGVFMEGNLTYLYGFFQLMFCQFPLIFIYASMVDYKFRQEVKGGAEGGRVKRTRCQKFWPHIPFAFIITVEVILAVFYFIAYGTVSFVMGPLRTWSVILHIVLFHQAYTLNARVSLRSGMAIWAGDVK